MYSTPTNAATSSENAHILLKLDAHGTVRSYQVSSNGQYIAIATSSGLFIYHKLELAWTVSDRTSIVEMSFSPTGRYLQLWERTTADKPNAALLDVKSKTEILAEIVRNPELYRLQWASDDSLFFKANFSNGQLAAYSPENPLEPKTKATFDGMKSFSVAPVSCHPVRVAIFIGEKNGSPGSVRIFNVPHWNSPVSMKSFFKADRVSLFWNHQGSNLLVLAQTDIDRSGKSYYGETHLVFLSADGKFDCLVRLDADGPIHDLAWRPQSNEFAVIYGFMPAQATLFNGRCEPIHSFGKASRNYIKFNPQGSLLLLAGFGNLAGHVDIYSLPESKSCVACKGSAKVPQLPAANRHSSLDVRLISSFQASNTTTLDWSPSGTHLLFSTLSPRLRVDNCIKLFHYHGGAPLLDLSFKELLQADWLPVPSMSLPFIPIIPIQKSNPALKSNDSSLSSVASSSGKAYVPPSKRGVATAPCPVGLDIPNATKKPVDKYGKNGQATAASASSALGKSKNKQEPSELTRKPSLTPKEKLVKNISEKLDQIKILKEKQGAGQLLELNQLEKINKELDLLKQLSQLSTDA